MSDVTFPILDPSAQVKEIFDELTDLAPVLAGGAARSELTGEKVADYDVFFPIGTDLKEAEQKMLALGWLTKFRCPAGELVSMKKADLEMQLICKPVFSSASELIAKFDFTACMFAVDSEKALHTTTTALQDVFKRMLRINLIEYPVATLRRTEKYIARGYRADAYFWRTVVRDISSKEWSGETLEMYPID